MYDSEQHCRSAFRQYVHRAETRLLQIAEGDEHGLQISCTMTVARLQEPTPKYAALSYVWGDATDTEAIVVNSQPFQATKSLASTVRQLRASYAGPGRDGPRLFWADAVCINQQDMAERGRQVSMMGAIYSKASRVVSWLGPALDDSEAGCRLIRACARYVEEMRN